MYVYLPRSISELPVPGVSQPLKTRLAPDSRLEHAGFEPSVPSGKLTAFRNRLRTGESAADTSSPCGTSHGRIGSGGVLAPGASRPCVTSTRRTATREGDGRQHARRARLSDLGVSAAHSPRLSPPTAARVLVERRFRLA